MTENWGVPAELSRSTVGTMQAVEAGEFDVVSPDYRAITGRAGEIDAAVPGVGPGCQKGGMIQP